MWPGSRMKTGTCPCCKVCKNCPGFQKVLDRPDSGFIIYRHITHVEDINKKTGVIEATTDTIDDVFIIENTKGAVLKKIDFTPEIDRNQISCPRCVKILQHAQSLLKNQEIDSDIIGVCEHCRQKSQRKRSCLKCDEIVEKFQLNRSEGKQTHAQRVKTWLSKIQNLLTLALDEEKGKKTDGQIRRGHSEIDISKLFRKVSKTDHEPEIEDLFLQNIRGIQSALKGPASERSYFPGSFKEVAFYDPQVTKPIYGLPQEGEDFQPLLRSQSNATLTEDELEKDFIRKYGKSYKEKRSFEDPAGKVRYLDERYNEFIPPDSKSYDDDSRHGGIRGKDHKYEYFPDSDSRHEGVRGKEPITDSYSRHEGVRGKEPITDSSSRHEGVRGKEPITDSSSRHEGVRGKEPITDSYSRHEGVRGKEPNTDSSSRHEGVRGKEPITDSYSRHEGVRGKEPITDSYSRHEGVRGNEPIKESNSRNEGVRGNEPIKEPNWRNKGVRGKKSNTDTYSRHEGVGKEPIKESRPEGEKRKEPVLNSDSRHEGGRRKEIDPTDRKYSEINRKKGFIPDPDSGHEGGKRKDQVPEASKYRDDRNMDFIPAPKTRHEEEKKKAGMRRDDEIPDEIKKGVRDSKKEDFIAVIGRRFEEEIEAKGLTLAPKKSQFAKKRKDLATASETRLEYEKHKDIISTDKEHKIGKKAKAGTKILFESPSHIKKYHSEESLIAGISKMKDGVKSYEGFDLYFPEKPEVRKKKLKIGEDVVNSAELIKDTIDKLKTTAEKKKSMREDAERLKAERAKKREEEKLDREKKLEEEKLEREIKLEEEKLERERLLAEKLAAKLERDKEREEKAKETGIEPRRQDTSIKDQDEPKKVRDLIKKDRVATKKDGDIFKKDKDVSKKDQDTSKKKLDDEMIKEKTAKEKVKKEADIKGKEREGKDTKYKSEDQLKAANIKAKEDKQSEETTKDKKVKSKDINIEEIKGKEDKIKEMQPKDDKEVKLKEGTTKKRDTDAENLVKQLAQEAKDKEKLQQELRQQKEEEKRLKLLAEQKAKEAANQPKGTGPETRNLGIVKRRSRPKILDLIHFRDKPRERKNINNISPLQIKMHRGHNIKQKSCDICVDSDLELDLQSLKRRKQEELEKKDAVKEAIIGETIHKFKTQMPEPQMKEEIKPKLFQTRFEIFGQEIDYTQLNLAPEPQAEPKQKGVSNHPC